MLLTCAGPVCGDLLDLRGPDVEGGGGAAAAWRQAESVLAGGDLDGALVAYDRVRVAGVLPPAARLRQAQVLAASGRLSDAMERCAGLPPDDGSPESLAGMRLRARLLAATGRWGEAAAALAALLDAGRLADDPAAWLEVARWREHAGDPEEARRWWEAAGAKGIWPVLSDLERARLHAGQGEVGAAEARWQAALLADPDCQEALAGLAWCQLAAAEASAGTEREARHRDEARRLGARVRDLEPLDWGEVVDLPQSAGWRAEHPGLHAQPGRMPTERAGEESEGPARQLMEARAAVESAPLRADAWLRLAKLSLSAGRWWRGREALWMADSLALTDPRPAWGRARELARQGQWGEAADALDRAARLHPAGSDIWVLMAQARARLGEAERAAAAWAAAAALLPGEEPIIRGWRDAAYVADDRVAASRAARRAVRLAPSSADAWLRLGDIERRRGALGPAEFAYRKVIELAGDAAPAMVYYRLSQTLEQGGDAPGSAAMLERWRARGGRDGSTEDAPAAP